jgi:hypothetical protein
MVVTPSHPALGTLLQVNKLSSSRRVRVLDALVGDTYNASAGRSNSVHFGLRFVAHVAERPRKPVPHSTHGYTGIDRRITAQNCKPSQAERDGTIRYCLQEALR